MTATVPLPQFTDSIDLRYFIEPLSGPTHPRSFLERFPDALYNKALDSHLVRFMYALLGPSGIGWVKAELVLARLALEAAGAELFDLESFYGDPFAFGRILTESFDYDVSGLLPASVWDTIRAQDESYRSRAIQFFNAARLGTSPEGMRLAATSGTGQEMAIVENYRYLFDQRSDDLLGLPYYGSTLLTGEFVVVPRPATSDVVIADAERHHMQVALDYLRPVASVPSFHPGATLLRTQPWNAIMASSQAPQVHRYVTGSPAVAWPDPTANNVFWIEAALEKQAPQPHGERTGHYIGWHNVAAISAYSDTALTDPAYASDMSVLGKYNSVHIGPFPELVGVMPYFDQFTDTSLVFGAERALADYAEPLTVSAQTDLGGFINGIYPLAYAGLQGTPTRRYHDDHFWSSRERPAGAEVLEIDLGTAQAVNYIALEVSRKPLTLTVEYDTLDLSPARRFTKVQAVPGFDQSMLFFDPSSQNPWEDLALYFNDGREQIFTRFIRLTFTRRADTTGRFLYDPTTNVQAPWSIDVRNLRVGRNVAPSVV